MAATVISEQVPVGPYQAESNATKLGLATFVAGDNVNGNRIIMGGHRVLLQIRNDGVGAGTVTISSSKDSYGRVADITAYSVAADAMVERIFEPDGWESVSGGKDLNVTVSAATMMIRAVRL